MNPKKMLLKNIKSLIGVYENPPQKLAGLDMKTLPLIENAWLACEDGLIIDLISYRLHIH
jgi:hypothetical protein